MPAESSGRWVGIDAKYRLTRVTTGRDMLELQPL
jgi:hypothetical protein